MTRNSNSFEDHFGWLLLGLFGSLPSPFAHDGIDAIAFCITAFRTTTFSAAFDTTTFVTKAFSGRFSSVHLKNKITESLLFYTIYCDYKF